MSTQYNFASVVDEFTALKSFPAPHGPHLRHELRERALAILAHPDIRYMPAFKILDMLAELVNLAAAIASEPQLRRNEATALLHSHCSDTAPLVQHFMLEAALERARYEPLMLEAEGTDALAYRNLILSKRWQAMLAAHQALVTLPASWVVTVGQAVEQSIHAPAFTNYRTNPLLQLFAEMLQQARQLFESGAPVSQLAQHIGPHSALWKRYALKIARYQEKGPRAQPQRVPNPPAPLRHSLH